MSAINLYIGVAILLKLDSWYEDLCVARDSTKREYERMMYKDFLADIKSGKGLKPLDGSDDVMADIKSGKGLEPFGDIDPAEIPTRFHNYKYRRIGE
jgi:hypothetical protein